MRCRKQRAASVERDAGKSAIWRMPDIRQAQSLPPFETRATISIDLLARQAQRARLVRGRQSFMRRHVMMPREISARSKDGASDERSRVIDALYAVPHACRRALRRQQSAEKPERD